MSTEDRFEIDGYWLEQRDDSPNWYRCWYDATAKTSKRRGRTKRASLGTRDFQRAKIALAEWVIQNKKPQKQLPKEIPVEQVLLDYWSEHAKHIASWETAKYAMKKWSNHYPGKMLSEVTLESQRAFLGHMIGVEKLSHSYAKRVLAVGKAAINHAFAHGRITSPPAIELPGVPDPDHRRLDATEIKALFENVRSEHGFMYLLLAFTTLARESTILELTYYQVDVPNRLIKLNPPGRVQTKKRRPDVPIPNVLLPYVKKRREGLVVNYHGKPITSVKKMLAATGKRAGIGPIGSRVPRHTMATILRKQGVPHWEVEGQLGHRVPSTSETYAAYSPDYLSEATKAIDTYLQEHIGLLIEQRAKELKVGGRG